MKCTYDSNNNPWTSFYKRMEDEVPTNDVEKEVLVKLKNGAFVSECRKYAYQNGYTAEEFTAFFDRATKWENENCSRVNGDK